MSPSSSIRNLPPRTMPTMPLAVTAGDSISRRAAGRLASSKRLTGGASAASERVPEGHERSERQRGRESAARAC
jgi:hypothetical protein